MFADEPLVYSFKTLVTKKNRIVTIKQNVQETVHQLGMQVKSLL